MTGSLLHMLGRYATGLLAASLFVGFLFPALAAIARPLLMPAVAGLLFLSMIRFDWPQVMGHIRRPLLSIACIVWVLIVCPLIMWLLVQGMDSHRGLAIALVLMAAAPPIMSSPALAQILGLDANLSLIILIASLMMAPLTLPFIAIELLQLELAIDTPAFMGRLALLIGGTLIGALIVRRLAGRHRIAEQATALDGTAVILMGLFALAIMDGVTAQFMADPGYIGLIVVIAFAANLGLQAASAIVFAGFGAGRSLRRALTVGHSSGNGNMGLLLAVLPAGIDANVPLFFALGQLPIYILPVLMVPAYRWWLGADKRSSTQIRSESRKRHNRQDR